MPSQAACGWGGASPHVKPWPAKAGTDDQNGQGVQIGQAVARAAKLAWPARRAWPAQGGVRKKNISAGKKYKCRKNMSLHIPNQVVKKIVKWWFRAFPDDDPKKW